MAGKVKKGSKTVVRLEGDLTIARAAEIKGTLLGAFGRADHVELDLAEVESIDLACMQLICAAHRTAVARKAKILVADPSLVRMARPGELAGFCRESGCVDDCIWSRVRRAAA